MREKLKDSGGFSFTEMLCAVVLLVMLCLMMNTGLSMAMKTYHDITAASETRLLLNSLTDALTDKLRYAIVTEKKDPANPGGTITECSIASVEADDTTYGQVKVNGTPLLPAGAYGEETSGGARRYKAEVDFPPPDYSGPTPVFTVKLKVKETSGSIGAETATITVRCLNPVKKEVEP